VELSKDLEQAILDNNKLRNIFIVIDRLIKKDYKNIDNNDAKRLKDSINLAYKAGK
jgi:hypothetical protein